MPQSAAKKQAALLSLEAALGVKGLRVRPYGSVKNAHIVLKKVEEEEYEDDHGRKKTRSVFSLFAHKLINVKAGKELFLYLHPANGELQEQSIAFEGDLIGSNDDELLQTEARDSSDGAKTAVVHEQALPPKMRKAWARKASLQCISVAPGACPRPYFHTSYSYRSFLPVK